MTFYEGLSALVGLAFAIVALYPLVIVMTRLFWNGDAFDPSPLMAVIRMPDLPVILKDTALVVATSAAVALVLGGYLAWLNERTDARLGVMTDSLPLASMLLPAIAGSIAWVILLSPHAGFLNWVVRFLVGTVGIEMESGPFDINSWYGLCFVYTLQMVPFAFLAISGGFRHLDSALEEQARVCGSRPLRILCTVTIPSILPSIVAAIFLLVWVALSTVSVPIIIAQPAGIEILSVRIVRLLNFTYPPRIDLAVGLGGLVLLPLAALWYLQRRLLRGQRFGTIAGKGIKVRRAALGVWRWPARGLFILYGVVSIVLPIAALLVVSLQGYWTTDIDWKRLSVTLFYQTLTRDLITIRALQNSILLGFAGACLCTLIAAIVSLWVFRTPTVFARAVDAAIKFPGTMSSVVLAIGIVLAFAGPPFHLGGTVWILFMAYIATSLPEGSVLTDAAVAAIGRELAEASHAAGAGQGRTFLSIYAPLMAPGLLAAWSLLFVRIVGDVNASSILASSGNTVVGFRILEIYTNGSIARLAVVATALTGISALVLIVSLALSRRWSRWTQSPARPVHLNPA